MLRPRTPTIALSLLACATPSLSQEKLHYTYLWHMEQPIYWPDQQNAGADRYERAWESIVRGGPHPSNNLVEIFSKPDRVAAYQYRVKDSIDAFDWSNEAGVQVSFSGGLIENLFSLGDANQLGYSPTWFSDYRTARTWTTIGQSKPRCDIVVFPFHHPLCPLIAESTLRKEIQLYQAVYDDAWGATPPVSRGFFPSEMAFSTRMIRVLAEEGIDWAFVSGEKISRACADFPVQLGSGGVNCDPPNRADQINPAQGDYYRVQISRGCAPAEAYPYAFTPHRAQHVDPDTGQVYEIIVVPCAQAISWEDGSQAIGTGHFDALQPLNDPGRPMLAALAHDGDNFFAGGYSYYLEATPNLASSAVSTGYVPTTVEEYLADHPVPAGDVVHVEDGAWVNADGDFGSPQFWNWNYPPVNAQGDVDIENGWAEDIRNWAVITAAQNHVDTAEQISTDLGNPVDINKVLYPETGADGAERAWHYFLGALNSGYMYYGTAEDFEVKPSIACNEALQHTAPIIGDGSLDQTGPTVWIPQRWPWNPGEMNFGSPYGYQPTVMPTDLWVWSFVHDVSGLQSVTLKYRIDNDGANPLASTHNETYAGGAEVGAWQSVAMTGRAFPAHNFFNDPGINFFEMPDDIADQYHAMITGLSDVLIDYYIESVDTRGNITRSPIQHVWIGDGEGSTGSGDPRVTIDPDPGVGGQTLTVNYDAVGGPLAGASPVYIHFGFNGWNPTNPSDPQMTFDAGSARWEYTLSVPANATQFDCVFNDGGAIWDNNNGQDWHFSVTPGEPVDTWDIDGSLDTDATLVASDNGVNLWAGLKGSVLYLATQPASGGFDRFLLLAGESGPGPLTSAMWAKGGQVASWSAFVGNEESNGFNGWFDGIGDSAIGSVLEATIDLNGEFGSVPQGVHAAVALYATPDGGALDASRQVPPTVNSNGNIDAGEYLELDLCTLGPDFANGCAEPCPADLTTTGGTDPGTADGVTDLSDLLYYVNLWDSEHPDADIGTTGMPGAGPDGDIDLSDLLEFVNLWSTPCP